jgi:biotin carboxyl carrier protein
MRRVFSLGGKDHRVEVRSDADGGTLRLAVEGADEELVARETPGGWTITRGRTTVETGVVRERSGVIAVQLGGHTYRVETRRGGPSAASGSTARDGRSPGRSSEVRTPMPGKVVRLLREEGEEVAAGDGVLVFEAMKMQNEIRAPESGVIANMKAAAGAPMESGELLFAVAPGESA